VAMLGTGFVEAPVPGARESRKSAERVHGRMNLS